MNTFLKAVCMIAAAMVAPRCFGQDTTAADVATRKSQAYDNPQVFAHMSGAKRTALERKFGRRPVRGAAFTGEAFADATTRAFAGPLAPFGNILVNNPMADATAQDTQSETAVVFGSGTNVVAAFNDSGAHLSGQSRFTGWALSTDGGVTFTDKGDLPDNPDGDSGDPVFCRSAKTGTIFLSTLSFNTGHKLLVFRSTDNGVTFQAPVNGTPGFTAATGEQDKQWIAVDNAAGEGFGNVYMFWRNFAPGGGMTLTRSTDDGITWGPNGGLKLAEGVVGGMHATQGAYVAVGPDHAVYAFWHDESASPNELRVRKSTDQGASFGAAVTVAKLNASGVNGDLGLSPGFRTNSFPQVVVSPTNAAHLFVVYNDHSGSGATLDRGNIFLVRSTDGGATWSAALQVNDDLTRHDQWQPTMAITPDGKQLCVAWYDRRLDSANNLIDRFAAISPVSTTGTVTFGTSFRVTSQSFPPVFGADPLVNESYMGDYDQMTASDTHFGMTWGDNRDDSTGHAGKNANVRFANFGLGGTTDPGGVLGGPIEPSTPIPFENVPEFARQAISHAVDQAPADVLSKPVVWEKAFALQETIAMFMVRGKDAKGQPIEAESKGTRVIELEVLVPPTAAPAAVRTGMRAISPAFSANRVTAIIVGGRVVSYTVVGADEAGAGPAGGRRTEANFATDGKLISRRGLRD